MRSSARVGVGAALCLLLGVAGCGGKDTKSEADLKQELSQLLQGAGGGGFDAKAADCYAQIIIDDVGAERLQKVDFSADEPSAAIQDDISAAAVRAATECDLGATTG